MQVFFPIKNGKGEETKRGNEKGNEKRTQLDSLDARRVLRSSRVHAAPYLPCTGRLCVPRAEPRHDEKWCPSPCGDRRMATDTILDRPWLLLPYGLVNRLSSSFSCSFTSVNSPST